MEFPIQNMMSPSIKMSFTANHEHKWVFNFNLKDSLYNSNNENKFEEKEYYISLD
jgi:hypothetical protein